MLIIYNIFQFVSLAVFWPLIILFLLSKKKYRCRLLTRLGFGLGKNAQKLKRSQPTIWVHALSLGEVTSSMPLVQALRARYPQSNIVFTAATMTGRKNAEHLLRDTVDLILDSPFDLLPVVHLFIRKIRPDLFILVETDFWPNLLGSLKNLNIPTLLVNGRVSEKSMAGYRRFAFFFLPMFKCFSKLCMQTERDQNNMAQLGIPRERLHSPGNLKFDMDTGSGSVALSLASSSSEVLIIAGSTHSGEETMLLDCFSKIRFKPESPRLVIAPRDISRSNEIQSLIQVAGFSVSCTSSGLLKDSDVIIVDSLGELAALYGQCDIAFVGGSLVARGGHNPIEPAIHGLPVIFGPHMEDFHEIATELTIYGGGFQVSSAQQLCKTLEQLLSDQGTRKTAGDLAKSCVIARQGVINKHMEIIQTFL